MKRNEIIGKKPFSVTQKLEAGNWGQYLNRLSRRGPELVLQIEVFEPSASDPLKTAWSQMRGIAFDTKNNQIDILVDSLDHRISRPKAIYARTRGQRLESLEVLDEGNRRQLIRFKQRKFPRSEH